MRQNSGMRHANANQSSLNNLSVRIYLPQTRNNMTTAAKIVHHQHTNNVALSSRNVRAGGGELYKFIFEFDCPRPPTSAEGTSEELKDFAVRAYDRSGGELTMRMPTWTS
jgi:hypothetical protein